MFFISKRKLQEKIDKLQEEMDNQVIEILSLEKKLSATEKEKKVINKELIDLKNEKFNLEKDLKKKNIIINQFEINFQKDKDKIEKLNDKLIQKELLRRKAAGKIGGLTASYNKVCKEKKALLEIIQSQEQEKRKLKCRISPPTIEELKAGRKKRTHV